MNISNDSRKLIEDINDYSNKPIKNIFEISVIIESAVSSDRKKEFKDLIFTGKYVNGLKNVLSNRYINDDEYMEKIYAEFNKNLQKVINLLKDIITGSEKGIIKHFNEKYFSLNQESIINVINLIEDLSLCKEYLNNSANEILG